jgi:uncharacterized protein YndB with AHSA1/START domain
MTSDTTIAGDAASGFTLTVSRRIAAPPARVFAAFTDKDLFAKWFGPHVGTAVVEEMDVRPGGRYSVLLLPESGERYRLTGSYREVEAPERLVMTWTWDWAAGVETVVTVEFRARADGTELVITHAGFPDEALAGEHRKGWRAGLDALAAVLSET